MTTTPAHIQATSASGTYSVNQFPSVEALNDYLAETTDDIVTIFPYGLTMVVVIKTASGA